MNIRVPPLVLNVQVVSEPLKALVSMPVLLGNEAASQFQLDVFGEAMDAGHVGRLAATAKGISLDTPTFRRNWPKSLADAEEVWRRPDEGIWEVRGPSRPFTNSRVMAWV